MKCSSDEQRFVDAKITVELGSKYFSKPFFACVVVSAFVIVACLVIGSFRGYNASLEVVQSEYNHTQHLRATLGWQDIFFNNYGITLICAVPFAGAVYMGLVQLNTGFIVGNLARATGINNLVYVAAIVTHPVGILEYVSYVLILSESLYLFYAVGSHGVRDRWKRHTWKTLVLATGLLLAAAFIEWAFFLGR